MARVRPVRSEHIKSSAWSASSSAYSDYCKRGAAQAKEIVSKVLVYLERSQTLQKYRDAFCQAGAKFGQL
jgi:hypothetical protein